MAKMFQIVAACQLRKYFDFALFVLRKERCDKYTISITDYLNDSIDTTSDDNEVVSVERLDEREPAQCSE